MVYAWQLVRIGHKCLCDEAVHVKEERLVASVFIEANFLVTIQFELLNGCPALSPHLSLLANLIIKTWNAFKHVFFIKL